VRPSNHPFPLDPQPLHIASEHATGPGEKIHQTADDELRGQTASRWHATDLYTIGTLEPVAGYASCVLSVMQVYSAQSDAAQRDGWQATWAARACRQTIVTSPVAIAASKRGSKYTLRTGDRHGVEGQRSAT